MPKPKYIVRSIKICQWPINDTAVQQAESRRGDRGMAPTWGMELRRLSVGDRGTLWKTFSLSLPLSPLGRLSMMASERKLLCRLLWLSKPILPCTSAI